MGQCSSSPRLVRDDSSGSMAEPRSDRRSRVWSAALSSLSWGTWAQQDAALNDLLPGSGADGASQDVSPVPSAQQISAQLEAMKRSTRRSYRLRVLAPLVIGAGSFTIVLAGSLVGFGIACFKTGWHCAESQLVPSSMCPFTVFALVSLVSPSRERHVKYTCFVLAALCLAMFSLAFGDLWWLVVLQPDLGARECVDMFAHDRVSCPCMLSWIVTMAGWSFLGLVSGANLLRLALSASMATRIRLAGAWFWMGASFFFGGFFPAVSLVVRYQYDCHESSVETAATWVLLFGLLFVGGAMMTPAVRRRVHLWLAARSEAVGMAAAIASMLGDDEPRVVQKLASERFRVVPIELITKEHLRSSVPDPALWELSVPALLGEADGVRVRRTRTVRQPRGWRGCAETRPRPHAPDDCDARPRAPHHARSSSPTAGAMKSTASGRSCSSGVSALSRSIGASRACGCAAARARARHHRAQRERERRPPANRSVSACRQLTGPARPPPG